MRKSKKVATSSNSYMILHIDTVEREFKGRERKRALLVYIRIHIDKHLNEKNQGLYGRIFKKSASHMDISWLAKIKPGKKRKVLT